MIFICFAAFNEEHNVGGLIRRTAAALVDGYCIVAYDDGSTDATYAQLQLLSRDHPLMVLHSDTNRGLGAGLARLIDYVAEHGSRDDVAVLMDGDDTHDPDIIPAMVSAVEAGSDVVIASRFCPGSRSIGVPPLRQSLSRAASLFWRIMLGLPQVRDYTSGFRAYRVGMLKEALAARDVPLVSCKGFECQVELLARLAPHATISELPIHLVYDRKRGPSKMRLVRTVLQTLALGCRLKRERRGKQPA